MEFIQDLPPSINFDIHNDRRVEAQKKHQEVEAVLKTQMEWQIMQKVKLRKLQEQEISDMAAMTKNIESEEVVNAIKAILEKRYKQLDMMFDDNRESCGFEPFV